MGAEVNSEANGKRGERGERVHVLGQRPTQNVGIASKGYQYKYPRSPRTRTRTRTRTKAIKENG